MKGKSQQIETYFSKIGSDFFASLIYGPDYGVKTDIIDKITNIFLGTKYINNIINIDLSVSENNMMYNAIFSEMLNYSLIPTKKVIKVKNLSNKSFIILEQLVDKLSILNKDIFLIIILEDLDTRSAIRNFCENNNNILAIPCYSDMPQDTINIVTNFLKEKNINFEKDVPQFIASNITSDRIALKNELLKIETYIATEKLTIEKCKHIIDSSFSYTPDVLLDSIGLLKIDTALKELDNAINEGHAPVTIIRYIISHFSKLKEMLQNINNGSSPEEEIIKHRIFFKRVQNYQKQLKLINIKKINILLHKLFKLETFVKQHTESISTSAIIYEIANL